MWVRAFGRSPFGDCTCSAEVNSACAKVLRCKTLGTPDFRRVWTSVCGANLPRMFFTFPKRTVGEIDKCTGFWYNECKKQRICCCTLPMQGLLLLTFRHPKFSATGCTLPIQVSPTSPPGGQPKTPKRKAKLHGSFAFVLCREVTSRSSGRGSRPPGVPANSRGGAGSAAGRRPGQRCRPERWEPGSSRLG